MERYRWLVVIFVVFYFGLKYGQMMVEKLTGRSSEVPRTNLSDLSYLIFALGIGFLPDMVMTEASREIRMIFFCIGIGLGTLAKQALYGRKGLSNDAAADG